MSQVTVGLARLERELRKAVGQRDEARAEAQRLRDTLARYGSQEHALKKAIAELCELVDNDRAPGFRYVEWHDRYRDLIATETAPADMSRRSRPGA